MIDDQQRFIKWMEALMDGGRMGMCVNKYRGQWMDG